MTQEQSAPPPADPSPSRPTRLPTAQRGGRLRATCWRSEALLRMLENVLEVAEDPGNLVVYAALGKAARSWEDYEAIVSALLAMREDQTLILQSGVPIALMTTHRDAPMVLSAVNNTVGRWATPEIFYARADRGQTIWGGLTAAAWQYIGRQGVLQGTYEVLRAACERDLSRDPARRPWLLTSGLGGMGSAQPTSARMADLSSLTVEIDEVKVARALSAGVLDHATSDLDVALAHIDIARLSPRPTAVALVGNAAEVYDRILRSGALPDVVTDQTAAHDARCGYVPEGYTLEAWREARRADPAAVERDALRSMCKQVRTMLALGDLGSVVFENGNNLRSQAHAAGVSDAFAIPGFMERYLRPLFARGIGPFRWVALSGNEADLAFLDEMASELFPERPEVASWISLAREGIATQGLTARSCWLGHGERTRMAQAANEAVADGRLSAPVLFTRDHLDSAGMTHPRIGTEGMRDGSDGVTDWPLLDAMLLCASGADLVAIHSGGGGYSGWMQSTGVSVVADGSVDAARRLAAALGADTGLGVLRHATAGYPEAQHVLDSQPDRSDGPPITWLAGASRTPTFDQKDSIRDA